MNPDVENRQHIEASQIKDISMLDILDTIKPQDVLPKTIYQTDLVVGHDIQLTERSDLSAAQRNLDRVKSNVFEIMGGIMDGTATEDEYSPISSTQHPGREDMSALINGVIQEKVMDTFENGGLISPTYNGPEIRRTNIPEGRVTELIQYRPIKLGTIGSRDGQRVYDWMEKVSTDGRQPDQLVLLRRGSVQGRTTAASHNGSSAR